MASSSRSGKRGFASMDRTKQREIASKGGSSKANHSGGRRGSNGGNSKSSR